MTQELEEKIEVREAVLSDDSEENIDLGMEILRGDIVSKLDQGVDRVSLGVRPEDASKYKEYFERNDLSVEYVAESCSPIGIEHGPNAFRHYLLVKKK